MKKKTSDFFDGLTLSEIATKLLSSRKIQPVLNRTFEQMMKLKSRLDSIMPLALGILNMPSVDDIKRLNSEVTKLNSKLADISTKMTKERKLKRKRARRAKKVPVAAQEPAQNTPGTQA
jgi:hypothetical protein